MPAFELRLKVPNSVPAGRSREIFYWSASHSGSIAAPFGPRLGRLGPVPTPNVDLVRLAVAVLAADRSTVRKVGRANWSRRDFSLKVPVSDPGAWSAITDELVPLLAFLTGDTWQLEFVLGRPPKEKVAEPDVDIARVVLLSGGADSACGALFSRHEVPDANQVFVSHLGATMMAPFQRRVAAAVADLIPGGELHHKQLGVRRRRRQIDGVAYRSESSSRSRSLLFLSLGLAVAAIHGVELLVPENGFASLNPPLGPERRGSLSTRTTQPYFLATLPAVLAKAGVHATLRNPCERMTKAEMFTQAASLVGNARASTFLSDTHSCAHTGHRAYGIPISTQCGVCFGCLVRRAAFRASGLTDTTDYLAPTTPDLSNYLQRHSSAVAVRDFADRGFGPRDIGALSLPAGYPLGEALDLCQRAISELRTLGL